MMKYLCLILSLLATPCFAAKVYQWRDSNGNVYYSDQAPPTSNVKQRTIRPNIVGNASASVTAAPATPLVLWIMPSCGSQCDEAIQLLDSRKLAYDVKIADPNKEATMIEYFGVVGSLQVRPPVLLIGKTVIKEYNSAIWHAALSKAGF